MLVLQYKIATARLTRRKEMIKKRIVIKYFSARFFVDTNIKIYFLLYAARHITFDASKLIKP